MDAERELLSKVIHGLAIDELIGRGIEPDHFADAECRAVYQTMLAHNSRYGQPPGATAVRDAHPDFAPAVTQESMDYLCDRFIRAVKRRKAIELYRDFGDACDDPERVEEIEVVALEMAGQLMDIVPAPRIGRYSDADNRIQDYLRRLAKGEPPGMMTSFPEIDRATVGVQQHEFVVVAGWQNSGKSSVMQRWAYNFYNAKKKVLFITLEMSDDECYERWDSMANRIEHRALRSLEIAKDSKEIERWREEAKRAKEFRAEQEIIVIDDIGSCTPDRVLTETRRYEPDVVFVDYLELMDPSRSTESLWQGVDQIGRQLKRNARLPISGKHVPVVVAAQTNADDGGKGASLDNISYKSTGKHADIVVGITRTKEMEEEKRMQLVLLKNRNGRRGVVDDCHFDPEYQDLHPVTGSIHAVRRHRAGEADLDDHGSTPPPEQRGKGMRKPDFSRHLR